MRSDIPLSGGVALPAGEGAVDLDIAFGTTQLLDPAATDGPYRIGADGFDFKMPGVGRYLCTTTHIVVTPADDARVADMAAMLIATVIPAWLWARGDVVLHAAAAMLPGTARAIAVLGRSGSGKSTMLARTVAAGGDIVADDSIRVCLTGDEVRISGLSGGYFAPLSSDGGDRPFHEVLPQRQRADAELGALLVLDDVMTAGRLTGGDAVGAILAHRHRPRIARLLGTEARAFQTIAALCRTVPIYTCIPPSQKVVDTLGLRP